MRLIILGGPGAGKGTQAQKLCSQRNIPHIATGDILRAAITANTELGQQAQSYLEKGELLPDQTMIQFIRLRLLQCDVAKGWLLDGYPRTAFQAEELDFLLDGLGQKLDWAIWLDVPKSVMIDRSGVRSRLDDQPEILKRRIDLFEERTIPILEYYEYRQRLLTINGNQSIEQVHQDILAKL